MYLVRKAGKAYGILGEILLKVGDGAKLKMPRPRLKIPCPLLRGFSERREGMPRKARRISKTGCYHVIVRGLNKSAIFKSKSEKTRILNLIKENMEGYNVLVYAYCIMSNHLHLLIKAELDDLASFMSRISTSFAHYYNYRHSRVGTVFQDRYRSQCIESESYFWNCLRYIHLNPVKAGISRYMEDYTYSSIGEYSSPGEEDKEILSVEAHERIKKRFQTRKELMDFHKRRDRYFFYDMPEDEFLHRKEISWDILRDMECELKLPAKEILDYTKTRGKFEKELKDLFKISTRSVKELREAIEKELKKDVC